MQTFANKTDLKQGFKLRSPRLCCLLVCCLWGWAVQGLAASVADALTAYSNQQFVRCYRMAMEVADESEDDASVKAKSLVLAAMASLELGKEHKAARLYQTALSVDSEVHLPKLVKSKRIAGFFEDVKSGRPVSKISHPMIVSVVSKSAFDASDPETYLPFGVNQYLQGKTLSAMAFGGMQAFSLYYAYHQHTMAQDTDKAFKEKTPKVIASGDYESPEFKDFRKKSQESAAHFREQRNLALLSSALVYGASVIEIVLNPPTRLKVVERDRPSGRSADRRQSRLELGTSEGGGLFVGFKVPLDR